MEHLDESDESRTRAGRRIAVVGTTGSGKTTFARRLSERLAVPHIELDALYWGPDWTPAPVEVFRERIAEAIAAPAWVADGNYTTSTGGQVWAAADTLVWLDVSIALIYRRLFTRTTARAVRGVELWNGNRESLRTAFFSRESLFVWALKTHWKHRHEWPEMLRRPEFAHLRLARLRSPKGAERYLATFDHEGAAAGLATSS